MARRRETPPAPERMILDAGAVIALARNDPRARAFIRRAIELDAEVRVPVVVLAETLRGSPRDAGVHRVLSAVSDSLPIDEAAGGRAGALLGRAGRSDTPEYGSYAFGTLRSRGSKPGTPTTKTLGRL